MLSKLLEQCSINVEICLGAEFCNSDTTKIFTKILHKTTSNSHTALFHRSQHYLQKVYLISLFFKTEVTHSLLINQDFLVLLQRSMK